jgi:hypothetical protein
MPGHWSITPEWEQLDSGSPEERACFASLGIQANNICLSEGLDAFANTVRKAPRLSAYHLAEWIAWNWWRLRWEPRSVAANWASSHRMTTIGGGYIWPNITLFSDGERIALIAKPTEERPQTPFRYIADIAAILQAPIFEAGADSFVDQVLQRLDAEDVRGTNLEAVWSAVADERRTPELAATRKLEALLGQEPDESNPAIVKQLIEDAIELSVAAVEEIAAAHSPTGKVATAAQLREIAAAKGFDASPRDVVRLALGSGLPRRGEVPAWRHGAAAAKLLREQEKLGVEPISNAQLAKLAGTEAASLDAPKFGSELSFALDENLSRGRVVLKSKWKTGRRFELARLLGDRIARGVGDKLLTVTRAYTYRQKMQRSFAAEFLSPFEVVDEMLAGDYSAENQQDVAEHFDVSPITVSTLLVNHGRLEREEFGEIEAAVTG